MWPFKVKKQVEQPKETVKSLQPYQTIKPYSKIYTNVNNEKAATEKFNNEALLFMYENVSQVNSVINYIATAGANIPVKHVKYLGNGKTKDLGETELLKSINSPNKKVSLNTFIEDIIVQFLVQGNCPIYKSITPGFTYPTAYEVLSAANVYKIPQYSIDQYGTPSQMYDVRFNPIVSYKNELANGMLNTIKVEEICYIKDKNARKIGIDYYYGASKLYAATRTIDVLSNLYQTLNTILAAKGALGFLKRTTTAGEIDPMLS